MGSPRTRNPTIWPWRSLTRCASRTNGEIGIRLSPQYDPCADVVACVKVGCTWLQGVFAVETCRFFIQVRPLSLHRSLVTGELSNMIAIKW
jgi:hypothetical protein